MTDHDNDNSHHADERGDEHVWCLERTARPLPATPGRTPGPSDSQTTHQNPRPTSRPTFTRVIILLYQALLVLLITNMISMGKTWSDLLKLCAASSSSSPLSKLSLLPAEAYSPPAQPRPNLNAVPHICTKMTLGCAFKAASRCLPPPTFHYTVL